MNNNIHVVIVTYNSEKYLATCLAHLKTQKHPYSSCTIVDNGSDDKTYLYALSGEFSFKLIESENRGFGAANNLAIKSLTVQKQDAILFLNPDAFLPEDCLSKCTRALNDRPDAGAIGGKLLAYDVQRDRATGKLDSTGVFRSVYGRWYDRGQSEEDLGQYDERIRVPAICGAFFLLRATTLDKFGSNVFDEDFFLYKEDIELSLRLRKEGWTLFYAPEIEVYHCRGWQKNRKDVDYNLRLMSAKNEIKLYIKHPSPYIAWALVKYFSVRLLKV